VAWNPSYAGDPTDYLVTASGGTRVQRLGYAVLTGLANGTPYTLTVNAVAVGAGHPGTAGRYGGRQADRPQGAGHGRRGSVSSGHRRR